MFGLAWFMAFNTTFNNISVVSWRSVLLDRKPEYPEKTNDLSQATDKLYHIIVLTMFNSNTLLQHPMIVDLAVLTKQNLCLSNSNPQQSSLTDPFSNYVIKTLDIQRLLADRGLLQTCVSQVGQYFTVIEHFSHSGTENQFAIVCCVCTSFHYCANSSRGKFNEVYYRAFHSLYGKSAWQR